MPPQCAPLLSGGLSTSATPSSLCTVHIGPLKGAGLRSLEDLPVALGTISFRWNVQPFDTPSDQTAHQSYDRQQRRQGPARAPVDFGRCRARVSALAALSRPLMDEPAYRLQRGSPETAGSEWRPPPPRRRRRCRRSRSPLKPPFSARFPCPSSFHNFNTLYRGNDAVEVVGFTAAQVRCIVGGPLRRARYPVPDHRICLGSSLLLLPPPPLLCRSPTLRGGSTPQSWQVGSGVCLAREGSAGPVEGHEPPPSSRAQGTFRCQPPVAAVQSALHHRPPACTPACATGPQYPQGLPIWPEDELEQVIREHKVDRCLLSYSDLPHSKVMLLAARCLAGERGRVQSWDALGRVHCCGMLQLLAASGLAGRSDPLPLAACSMLPAMDAQCCWLLGVEARCLVLMPGADLVCCNVLHAVARAPKPTFSCAAGADFGLAAPAKTMLESCKPVVAVCAVGS